MLEYIIGFIIIAGIIWFSVYNFEKDKPIKIKSISAWRVDQAFVESVKNMKVKKVKTEDEI